MVSAAEDTVDTSTEVLGWDLQHLASYFYADNSLMVSTRADRIQRAFGFLAEFLTRLVCAPMWSRRQVLRTNPVAQ